MAFPDGVTLERLDCKCPRRREALPRLRGRLGRNLIFDFSIDARQRVHNGRVGMMISFAHHSLASEAALHGCRKLQPRQNGENSDNTRTRNRLITRLLDPPWTTRGISPVRIGGIYFSWCHSWAPFGCHFTTRLSRPGPASRSFIGTKC